MANGNTEHSPSSGKQPSPKFKYDFVLNNYTNEEYSSIINVCNELCKKYVIAKEVGEKCGTPHLQCYINLHKKARITELKKVFGDRVSFRECRNEEKLITYCQKGGDFVTKGFPKPVKIIDKLYDWQKSIENIFFTEPDGRSVYWYCDYVGGKGKSSFCKYMFMKHRALVIQGGKLADIMNIIFNWDMDNCSMIIIDIPRNNGNNVSYNSIECILNGMITNTKYETGIKVFNPPHVIVFSNFMPDESKLSDDRWKIKCLSEPQDIVCNNLLD